MSSQSGFATQVPARAAQQTQGDRELPEKTSNRQDQLLDREVKPANGKDPAAPAFSTKAQSALLMSLVKANKPELQRPSHSNNHEIIDPVLSQPSQSPLEQDDLPKSQHDAEEASGDARDVPSKAFGRYITKMHVDVNLVSDIDDGQKARLNDPKSWFHPAGAHAFPPSNIPIGLLKHFQAIAKQRYELGLKSHHSLKGVNGTGAAPDQANPENDLHERRSAEIPVSSSDDESKSKRAVIPRDSPAQCGLDEAKEAENDSSVSDDESHQSGSQCSWSESPEAHKGHKNSMGPIGSLDLPPDSSAIQQPDDENQSEAEQASSSSSEDVSMHEPANSSDSELEMAAPHAEGERRKRKRTDSSKVRSQSPKRRRASVEPSTTLQVHQTPNPKLIGPSATFDGTNEIHFGSQHSFLPTKTYNGFVVPPVDHSSSESRIPATVLKPSRAQRPYHDDARYSSPVLHSEKSQMSSNSTAEDQIRREMGTIADNFETNSIDRPPTGLSRMLQAGDKSSPSQASHSRLVRRPQFREGQEAISRKRPDEPSDFAMTQSEEPAVDPATMARNAKRSFINMTANERAALKTKGRITEANVASFNSPSNERSVSRSSSPSAQLHEESRKRIRTSKSPDTSRQPSQHVSPVRPSKTMQHTSSGNRSSQSSLPMTIASAHSSNGSPSASARATPKRSQLPWQKSATAANASQSHPYSQHQSSIARHAGPGDVTSVQRQDSVAKTTTNSSGSSPNVPVRSTTKSVKPTASTKASAVPSSRPASDTAQVAHSKPRTSSSAFKKSHRETSMPRDWYKDEHTPFKHFARRYANLKILGGELGEATGTTSSTRARVEDSMPPARDILIRAPRAIDVLNWTI